MILKKYWWLPASMIVGLAVGMGASSNIMFEHGKNLEILAAVYKDVNELYVDGTEPTKLMKKGIKAMCAELDPYTVLIAEDEISKYRIASTSKYGGIGADIITLSGKVFLGNVFMDHCAQKAGLMAGDELVEIAGQSLENKSTEEITKMLNGSPGTAVNISLRQPGASQTISKNLIREEVKEKSVPYAGMINQSTGYVVLTSFTDKCGQELADAINKLKKDNTGMKSLVLDLRNNGGGLLNEAVNVSNLFVPKGTTIVTTKGKLTESNHKYATLNAPLDNEMPLVVITNKMSASASEIVSGSLQDLDRAVVVGQKSFGKGLVQVTRPLTFGNQLKVTTAKYYTPSGRCIQVLDYSHRNDDGSVGKVPDSLKNAFKTKHGRLVYDGGGIEPDVPIALPELSPLAKILIDKKLLFEAAIQYRASHASSPANLASFCISNADLEATINYIASKPYDYVSASEKVMQQLKTMSEKEKYFDLIKDDYTALKEKLSHDKKNDLLQIKEELTQLLNQEIIAMYFAANGRTQYAFTHDQEVLEACKLLNDNVRMLKILNQN